MGQKRPDTCKVGKVNLDT
jgi:hypothetical protein